MVPKHQIDASGPPTSVYEGYFADPIHPYCIRNIDVSPDGSRFTFTGTGMKVTPLQEVVVKKMKKNLGLEH